MKFDYQIIGKLHIMDSEEKYTYYEKEYTLLENKQVELTNNKTEVMFLNGISQDKDDYELRIIYNNNPAIVDDISGNVQIKVEAIQNEVI